MNAAWVLCALWFFPVPALHPDRSEFTIATVFQDLSVEPLGLQSGLLSALAWDAAPGRALLGDLERAVPIPVRVEAIRRLSAIDDPRARRALGRIAEASSVPALSERARAALGRPPKGGRDG